MAMSGGKDDGSPMMEMNTTPLIDVMLVLLIMFIITIPPITHAVKIDLPVNDQSQPDEPLVDPIVNKIIILPNSEIQWNGQGVTLDQLVPLLQQSATMQPEPELQFQPSPIAPYLPVDQVLAEVKRAEITKFGFVGNEAFQQFDKAAVDYK